MIRTVQLHDLAALCTRVARWSEGVRALVMAICCALHTFRVRRPPGSQRLNRDKLHYIWYEGTRSQRASRAR